jgi:hypothetical protein
VEFTPHQGHYKTVFGKDFCKKEDFLCPAKKPVDLKNLKDTIKEKINNLDREYGRIKKSNIRHQRPQ